MQLIIIPNSNFLLSDLYVLIKKQILISLIYHCPDVIPISMSILNTKLPMFPRYMYTVYNSSNNDPSL